MPPAEKQRGFFICSPFRGQHFQTIEYESTIVWHWLQRKAGAFVQRTNTLGETTLYAVKYSGLYFTWKLYRSKECLHVICSSENAEDESWQFGRHGES